MLKYMKPPRNAKERAWDEAEFWSHLADIQKQARSGGPAATGGADVLLFGRVDSSLPTALVRHAVLEAWMLRCVWVCVGMCDVAGLTSSSLACAVWIPL